MRRIPSRWGRGKKTSVNFFCADGVDVAVEGDGVELEEYLQMRSDLFNSWDRFSEEDAPI